MPKLPVLAVPSSVARWSIWALIRPTSRPFRTASHICTSACWKNGLVLGVRAAIRSYISGTTQLGSLALSRLARLTNRFSSALEPTGTMVRSESVVSNGIQPSRTTSA